MRAPENVVAVKEPPLSPVSLSPKVITLGADPCRPPTSGEVSFCIGNSFSLVKIQFPLESWPPVAKCISNPLVESPEFENPGLRPPKVLTSP